MTDDRGERILAIRRAFRAEDAGYLLRALADPEFRGRAADYLGRLGIRNAIGPITPL